MEKYIVISLLIMSFIISPVLVNAQVLSSTQLRIQQLQQQLINTLMSLIAQLQDRLLVLKLQNASGITQNASVLNIFRPSGGEKWQYGSTQRIGFNWQTNTFTGQTFQIHLLQGNTAWIIADNVSGTSYYDWRVGDTTAGNVAPGKDFSIEICGKSNFGGGIVCDRSDNYFEIYSSSNLNNYPNISLVAPIGGSYFSNETANVVWRTINTPYGSTVSLRLKDSNGISRGSVDYLTGSSWNFTLWNLNLAPGVYHFEAELKNGSTILSTAFGQNFMVNSAVQQPITTRRVLFDIGLDGVTVVIYPTNQPNSVKNILTTANNGEVTVPLQIGQSYTFDLSKLGYQSKSLTYVIPADTFFGGDSVYEIGNYLDPVIPVTCSTDRKMCSDGRTSVGRLPPRCEFSVCP